MGRREQQEELTNLRLAAARFEQLFQCIPIACLGCDLHGTIFEWNKACERIFGRAAQDLFMTSLFTVFCEDDDQLDHLGDMLDKVALGEAYESFEWSIGDGESARHLLCSLFPKPGPDGEVAGAILAGLDMTGQKQYELQIQAQLEQIHAYSREIETRRTELEQANERLASLALTDGLTGLTNHRAFYDALSKASKVNDGSMSVILLDVDNFKSFNDTFGHLEGDNVLRSVAKALLNASRTSDLVARYGGEEFAVLVRADRERSLVIAERMRSAIESAEWGHRPITASFGIAGLGTGMSAETVVALADEALYEAKRLGKNTVVHADDRFRAAA